MDKKYVLWIILLALVLVACGSGGANNNVATPTIESVPEEADNTQPAETESDDAPDAPAVETTTITFAVYDWEIGLYKEMIAGFEEENPDIIVKTVSINEVLDIDLLGGGEWPEDASQRLAAAADVIQIGVSSNHVEQGLLTSLTPFADADSSFDTADFYSGTLDNYYVDGDLYALPSQIDFQLIFFDKDAFDAAGLDYPQPGWSWEDLLAAAQDLTIRDGDEVTQWGFVEPFPSPLLFVQTRTDALFDASTDPMIVLLDTPEVANAVRWYTDLFTVYEVAPYVAPPLDSDEDEEDGGAFDLPEGYQLIEEGKAAMWVDFSNSWGFRSQQRNLGVVPFPIDAPDSHSSPLYSSSTYSISGGTRKAEAAWKWLVYLSAQEPADLGLGGPSALPSRRSVAAASDFWNEVDAELATALEFALEHAHLSSQDGGGAVFNALNEAIVAIVEDGESVENALADAQVAAENRLDEDSTETAAATPAPEIVVSDPEEEEADPDAVTITFITSGGLLDMETYRNLIDDFEAENPGVVVELSQPNLFGGELAMEDIAGSSDCFEWFPSLDDPDSLAAVLNLEPFLDNDPTTSQSDFFPVVVEDLTRQGQIWGLPGTITINVIGYNKELFDAAGAAYPSLDWTTDDFLLIATELTVGEDEETKQYGYVTDLYEPSDMLNFVDRLGAQLIDDSTDPAALRFTDPATVEAVRWFVNLTTEYEVKPVLMTSILNTNATVFQTRETLMRDGRVAMWSSSGVTGAILGGATQDYETGVVPLPASPDGARSGGYQSVTGYFISADTEAREACWNWITFLTRNATNSTGLPARVETANSDAYRQLVGDDMAEALINSIAGATEPSILQRFSDDYAWMGFAVIWLGSAYDEILNDGVSVEEALANIQVLADEYRTCLITNDGFSDTDIQEECVQEADPSLPSYLFGQ